MTDDRIVQSMLALIGSRADGATICPSEVARSLEPDDASAWRALMPDIRRVAGLLAARELVSVTQAGRPVDATAARGPIRLGRHPLR